MSAGTGPALLGMPANEVLDQSRDLGDVWPSRPARTLAGMVASDPEAALQAWAIERAAAVDVDPFGTRVLHMARVQTPVAVMANRLGLSERQFHRRCLPAFGYGPRRLARILRLGRALDQARQHVPLARVAVECGYADQAHLNREVRSLAGKTPTALLAGLAGR
jgi:AraC-like DNA-binding protein